LVTVGCIGVLGVICGFVVPVPDIVVFMLLMVPLPLIEAVMAVIPVVILEPLFMVGADIVCPPFELPPMANAWAARASAAITATVVNLLIC